jgi:hypothetical protein
MLMRAETMQILKDRWVYKHCLKIIGGNIRKNVLSRVKWAYYFFSLKKENEIDSI